jgi:general stress protein 26
MIGARIPGATRYLGAPAGWKPDEQGDCAHLAIRDMTINGDVPSMHSLWEPTTEEVARIVAGAKVRLIIVGTGHPPVSVSVDLAPDDQPKDNPQ